MTPTTKVLLAISVIAAIWWGLFTLIDTHNHNALASFNAEMRERETQSAQFEKETKETIQRLNRRETKK